MTLPDLEVLECQKVSVDRMPERRLDETPAAGPYLDPVSERAERRADDALSDFGSAAIGRRWRRDDDG